MTKLSIQLQHQAHEASKAVRGKLQIHNDSASLPTVGIILGTGFGGKLQLSNPVDNKLSVPLQELQPFMNLGTLQGHERKYHYGELLNSKRVLALSGRIHLNEFMGNQNIHEMVRLQTQIMLEFESITTLIITCAAGALPNSDLKPGDIMVIDSILSNSLPMPLCPGEFVSPEDSLSEDLITLAMNAKKNFKGTIHRGTYTMVIGPYFEGRKKDKHDLYKRGAKAVGMSVLPELCVASLYAPRVRVLALAFITNSHSEVHSHESNIKIAKESENSLGKYLEDVIYAI
jgi:purine nucleoside phosphorylase